MGSPAPEALDQALERSREALLGALFDDAALIDSLSHLPVLIPLAFKVGLFFVPLYVTLLAFDRISGELGPRSLRYVTVRARRGSILWGKLLAQGVLLVAVLVLVQVATVVAARLIDPAVGPRELVELVLRLTVAASVVGLTYLTLTTLCSTLSPVPAVSLVLNIAALFALWLVGAVGAYSEGALRVLQRAEPSFYADGLLSPTLGTFLGSLLAYLMFAVLFGGAAHLVLARRDL